MCICTLTEIGDVMKDLARIIFDTHGEIFTCRFIKRSTGQERVLVGKLGVTEFLKNGELPYDKKEKGLISVYDIENNGYRMIPIDGLLEVTVGDKVYKDEN